MKESLFERLQGATRPYEIAVGKSIENLSKHWKYIEHKTSMDYDVFIKNLNKELKIEVKVHAGENKMGMKYDTACLEILEYQYRHDAYVPSHWLNASFDIMAHVNKAEGVIHFYNGQKIRHWAGLRKHNARYSHRVKTANITMPWKCKEAGYILTVPLEI